MANIEVWQKEQSGVVALDFAADAGAGFEGTTADSFAIPRLVVLQKTSPQVHSDNRAAYIEGARPGMILETVTGSLYDGREGVLLIPAAFKTVYTQWAARETGEGFKGEHSPEQIQGMRAAGRIVEVERRLYAPLPDGKVNPERCDRFDEVRQHFCVLVEPSGAHRSVLLGLTSTQIKKSKALLSMLAAVTVPDVAGRLRPAPTFASMVRMTTVSESNDKGSWYGVRFVLEGWTANRDVYHAARALHASIAQAE